MPRTFPHRCADILAAAGSIVPAAVEPDRLAAVLDANGHVTILYGSGCVHEELLAPGESLQALMVHAMRREERVEWDNAIISGRADEMLHLTKTNLWR
jgi:pyruvate dehydrogenase (quinone)